MNKAMKRTLGVMAAAGVGYGAFLMYKKQNPHAMSDLKKATKETLRKPADMLDDTALGM